jgi:hypothetical protein
MDRVIELDASTGCVGPTNAQTVPVETKAAERRPMFRPNKWVKRTIRTKLRQPVSDSSNAAVPEVTETVLSQ